MKKLILSFLLLSCSIYLHAQVGIGTETPNASAILDVTSTSQGVLLPRMTTTQRDAIASPAAGLVVFNTTTNCINMFTGSIWNELCGTATQGTIATLNCSPTNNGTLTANTLASSVSSVFSYTGGNNITHNGQTVTSTGVTGLTATLASGTMSSAGGTLTYNITGTPSGSGTASFAINIGGKTCTLSRTVNAVGTISSLSFYNRTGETSYTSGVALSGTQQELLGYTGGNNGTYSALSVNSTGVTGLTATMPSGTFTNPMSVPLYITLSGTPSGTGTASFSISLGGQSYTITRTITAPVGSLASINCSGTTNGTLTSGTAASSVSSVINYTGGNAGTHSGQTVTSTGVTGLTATLTAGTFASGNGTLTYNITGTPSAAGTATFAISIGGQTCSLTRTVVAPVGTISSLSFYNRTGQTSYTSGVALSGTQQELLGYTGGNNGTYSALSVNSTGVTGLTATMPSGTFTNPMSVPLYITLSGTPSGTGTASFLISLGGQTYTITRTITAPVGSLASINCSGTTNGTLTSGTAASSVSSVISYTGGNAGTHSGQTVTSTGVTGLTATLTAGTFASGNGTLTYNITGTPSADGTATFAISIGGQTCSLTRTVALPVLIAYCSGTGNNPTTVVEITSGTGKVWMDRNLGASQVATSSSDASAYGDLYQWGRGNDGHQCRNSSTTSTLSTTNQPGHGLFILNTFDWMHQSYENNNLWQGVNGINNPCPSGFRVPTEAEWTAERTNWGGGTTPAAFFNSILKLTVGGVRVENGSIMLTNSNWYWSSTNNGFGDPTSIEQTFQPRSESSGMSVRCIKD